jgi:hypothetical protein
MKTVVLPIVLVAIAVSGGWYLWLQTTERAAGFTAPDATTTAQQSTPAAKSKAAPHRRGSTAASAPVLAEPQPVASQPEPVLEAQKTRLSPAPPAYTATKLGDVKTGMVASRVTQLLGEPDLKTLTTNGGSLSEVYFYAGKSYEDIGVIRLRNGRVMSPPARQ